MACQQETKKLWCLNTETEVFKIDENKHEKHAVIMTCKSF